MRTSDITFGPNGELILINRHTGTRTIFPVPKKRKRLKRRWERLGGGPITVPNYGGR